MVNTFIRNILSINFFYGFNRNGSWDICGCVPTPTSTGGKKSAPSLRLVFSLAGASRECCSCLLLVLETLSFTYTANDKRQIQGKNFLK